MSQECLYSGGDHLNIIKSVSNKIGEMTELKFPAFGSIYFHDAPIDPALKVELGNDFCIGPHCGSVLWNYGLGESDLYRSSGHDQGPCALSAVSQHLDRLLTAVTRENLTRLCCRARGLGPLSHSRRLFQCQDAVVLG